MRRLQRTLNITLCILSLTGCANYSGLHPQSEILNENQAILTNHQWQQQIAYVDSNSCWSEFHDPVLNQLIALGLSGSPNIQLAEARLRLASSQAYGAYANSMPAVTGNASVYRSIYSLNSIYPPPYGGNWWNFSNLSINFSYELDFWHKNQETFTAALGGVAAAQANTESAKLILASSIAATYYQIRGENNLIAISQQDITAQAGMVHLLQLEEKAQIISRYQIDQAKEILYVKQTALTQLQQQRQVNIDRLTTLVGSKVPDNIFNQLLPAQTIFNSIPQNIPLNLLGRRPDLIALRWNVVASGHKINAAKAAFYPDVNIIALVGLQSLELNTLFEGNSENVQYGPAISLPIFDAGRLRANLGMEDARYDIAVEQYNQGLLSAIQQAVDALTQIKSTVVQQQQQKLALSAAADSYHYSKAQYRAGVANLLDVYTAQQQYLQAEQQSVQLRVQYQVAIIKLIQALGGGYQSNVDFTRV